jgi:hypothetical protein
MINIFNNDLLKKCDIESLKINNNIIIDTNYSYNEKLNAKIININREDSRIHVRYYADCNTIMLTNNTHHLCGIGIKDISRIEDKMFIENGLDEIIDLNKSTIYKPYSKYPFFSNKKITKYGNKFVFEYYKTLYTINSIQSNYYNITPSTNYNNLPTILENKINIKYPVRVHNKYDSVLGCIIEGLPKIIKQHIDIETSQLEKYYKKYIILHMNNSFIDTIQQKYNIPYENILLVKYQLEDTIIDNFTLGIICSEIFKINLKIYTYINTEDIDLFDINEKELVSIYIYNTGDIYELITSKQFIMER